ncbi:MAG: 1,4-alpha-glucan branching enzyme, partial [Rhizobacter sp.]
MIEQPAVDALCSGRHGDPFAVLGPHADADGAVWLRVFLPGAAGVIAIGPKGGKRGLLAQRHDAGFFEGRLKGGGAYRLQVSWADGSSSVLEDPYRFGAVLGEMDVWLLGEGSHLRPYEVLGAIERTMDGVTGTEFAVWAPNASRASVVGDFNLWDGRRHPMRLRRECGVWELFVPGVASGARYKFELLAGSGQLLPQKADPYARQAELRPATASVVAAMPDVATPSPERQRANALDAPMSIYEVHLGSWRRKPEEGDRWLSWDELADEL